MRSTDDDSTNVRIWLRVIAGLSLCLVAAPPHPNGGCAPLASALRCARACISLGEDCMGWIMGAAALGLFGYGGWLVCSQLVYEWLQRELPAAPDTEEAPAALKPAQ